jgi:hypothetical protein
MTNLSPRAQDVWESFWCDARTPSNTYNHNIAQALRAMSYYCLKDGQIILTIAAELDEAQPSAVIPLLQRTITEESDW